MNTPEPPGAAAQSGDTGQARARGELARALAADSSLTWGELIYRAFQIRVGASRPWEPTITVQAPDVAAVLDRLNVAELADDEEQEFNDGQRWMLQKIRHALLGTDTTEETP